MLNIKTLLKANNLEAAFRVILQRFTVPFLCSLILAVVFLCHVRFNNGFSSALDINNKAWWYGAFISLIPSFFATVAASLVFENYAAQKPNWLKHVFNMALVLLLAAYTHYMLPFSVDQNIATFAQLGFWCFATVFVAHHHHKHDNMVFWYNTKSILVALLLAMFLSFVTLIGASCVLGAIDGLFGTRIIEPALFLVGIIFVFLLSPSLVLAQLPVANTAPSYVAFQPAGIVTKALVWIQWLLTLVLLAYAAQILVAWELPKGRVVYQVGSYAVGGMLVYFLSYHAQATKFVANYMRHWPKILLALAVLPALAIGMRIAAHGITPNRLLVVYLLVAIVGFVAITLPAKWQNKRLHFAALMLLAVSFLALFSPLNAQYMPKNYFGYDASQTIAQRLGHKLITSFNIEVSDVLGDNKLLNITPYTHIAEITLSQETKTQIILKSPYNLQLSLMPLYPQRLHIADLDTKQIKVIALSDLLNNHTLIKENNNAFQYTYLTSQDIPATIITLGKHQIKIMPSKINGYYNQTKDGDLANYQNIEKIKSLEFYLLIANKP